VTPCAISCAGLAGLPASPEVFNFEHQPSILVPKKAWNGRRAHHAGIAGFTMEW
jgi:hypothetical protein